MGSIILDFKLEVGGYGKHVKQDVTSSDLNFLNSFWKYYDLLIINHERETRKDELDNRAVNSRNDGSLTLE